MSHVTALVSDRVLQNRLRSAFAGRYRLQLVRDADQLWAALRRQPAALVVEARPDAATNVPALVGAVRARCPDVPVVGYCRAQRELAADVLALVRAGVHDLVIAGLDDDRLRLAGLVARAAGRSTTDDVLAHVTLPGVPAAAVQILRQFLEAAARPVVVGHAASALGVHRRTLAKRLDRARLPGPQELAAWCRLLVAARLLDDSAGTIERVAHDLEFPSANALRNQPRRHASVSPTALREQGGYAHLRGRFVARLAGGRARARGGARVRDSA